MYIFIIVILLSLGDIWTKWWAHSNTPDFPILGSWLSLTHVKNTGIAFSTPLPGIQIITTGIVLLLTLFILYSWKKLSHYEKIGYVLLVTGGALNAGERIIFGSVTDMISVKYFAVFNVADIAITAGAGILILSSFLSRKIK